MILKSTPRPVKRSFDDDSTTPSATRSNPADLRSASNAVSIRLVWGPKMPSTAMLRLASTGPNPGLNLAKFAKFASFMSAWTSITSSR
jgi:predicted glycosyltransferase